MDTFDILWLDSDPEDEYWEASYRRDYSDGDCARWDTDSSGLREVSGYYQEIGDDLARHERMAQAIYDC